jgi:hypothetical protein
MKISFMTAIAFSALLTIGCKEQVSKKAMESEVQAILPKT